MKKIVFVGLIFLIIIQCDYINDPNKPEKVINEYFKLMSAGNYERALDYISEKDKAILKNKYKFNKILSEFNTINYQLTSWEIKEVGIYKNEALVTIHLETPNIGELLGKGIADIFSLSYSNNNELPSDNIYDDVYNKAIVELKSGNFSYINVEKKLKLLKENNKWKIFLNLQSMDNVKNIILEANQLYREKKYNEAENRLKQVLLIDKNNAIAKDFLKRIEKERKTH